jgi:hypothetical protein
MKIVTLGVLVGLAVAAVACAGKSSDDPSSGDEQDIKASSTAKQGESCGGNVLGAKQCASGLTCVIPDSHIAGTPGTCQSNPDPTAKEGESCGGNILGAKQCASGLTCVFPQSNIAGTPGTCQSNPGPSCKFPVSCEDGTKGCADKGDPCASHGGECSAKGDACVTEHDCCSNLKCDNDSAKPTFNCIAK